MKFPILLIILIFLSFSAPAQQVNSISFSGSQNVSEIELLTRMATKPGKTFNSRQFQLDLASIRSLYKSLSYFDAKITVFDTLLTSEGFDIHISLDEGEIYKQGKISFRGNTLLPESRIRQFFYSQSSIGFNSDSVQTGIKNIISFYMQNGYPFATAEVTDISINSDSKLVDVTIKINENLNVSIDEIKIEGNEITSRDLIINSLRLNTSKISPADLDNYKSRLDKLDIFSTVERPSLYINTRTGKRGLLINVKEASSNRFDGIVGYIPPVNDADNGYFTGFINLTFKNLFGSGRKIDARWQHLIKGSQQLDLKYSEPFIFKLPLSAALAFNQRIEDSLYSSRRFSLQAYYETFSNFTGSVSIGFESVNPAEGILSSDSRSLQTGLDLMYDNRSSFYFPTSGGIYSTGYSYTDKQILNASELSQFNYKDKYTRQKYYASFEHYFPLFKRNSQLIRLWAGEVKGEKLEQTDLLRLGGFRTVRGYREEQFVASKMAYGNFEFRYSISPRSFLFLFYDAGYYLTPINELTTAPEFKEFIFGYGAGIRLETGLGLVSINYGLGKGDSPFEGKIHFGLVNDF